MKYDAPLAGLTVLALEHAIAAPLCTRQLAELGARVIKIERRGVGDFARAYDSRAKGQSSHFIWTNRGKESLTLDLKHEQSKGVLDALLQTADVLVQNLAPSAAARMGLSFDALHPTYPKLIVCNISGYGDSGPYQSKKAYDLLVQAEAGFLSITGSEEEQAKSGISIADIAAGTQAHGAILAAIIQRSKTGLGSCIDISMLEAMAEWMGFPLYYAYEGAQPPQRSGADHASIYPYGIFNAKNNGVVMLGIQNEREWSNFCDSILNLPDLKEDVRFNTNILRSENRDQLRELIEAQFQNLEALEISNSLDDAGIASAHVNDMQSLWDHPQLRALNRFIEVETPKGTVKSLLPPGKNSSYEPVIKAVPALGEHNRSILISLGFDESSISQLEESEVI